TAGCRSACPGAATSRTDRCAAESLTGSSLASERNRGEDALHDGEGSGGTAGDCHVDGDHVGDTPAARVTLAENATGATAIAYRHDQLGLGWRVEGALQRRFHVARHGSGHQQHISVTRAGDEPDAEPFQVVIR